MADYNITNTLNPLHLVTPSENPIWYAVTGIPTGSTLTTGYMDIEWLGGATNLFNTNDYIEFIDNWGNQVRFDFQSSSISSTSGRRCTSTIAVDLPSQLSPGLNYLATAINNSVLGINFFAEVILSAAPGGYTLRIHFKWNGSAGSLLSLAGIFPTPTGGSGYTVTTTAGTTTHKPQVYFRSPYTIARVYTNQEDVFPSTSDKGDKQLVGEMVKAFVGEDTIYFDPSHLLKTLVETQLPQTNIGFLQPHQLKRYWIEYGTGGWYGIYSNTSFDVSDSTDIRWILNAAQPLEYTPDLTDYWRNSANDCDSSLVRCLTNSPNTTICPTPVVFSKPSLLYNQRWWLSFICEVGGGTVEIWYEARYTGGLTVSNTVTVVDAASAPLFSSIGVLTVDVSPVFLGFTSLPPEIKDYKVQVLINGIPYTETRHYRTIENCLPSRTQLVFLNRLGGWDTYYFIGDNNTSDSRQTSDYSKTLPVTSNPFNRGSAQFNINYTRGLSLSSGQLTNCEFIWLEELLASNDIYIVNSKGELEAVILTKFDRKFSSREQLYTIDIEVEKSIPTNNINNTGISLTN